MGRVSARSLQNLRPFSPGWDARRNVGGRPKRTRLTDALIELLEQPYEDDPALTWAQAIALALTRKAADGNVEAAREIADRVEGKPAQQLAVRDTFHSTSPLISTKAGFRQMDDLSDEELFAYLSECREVLRQHPERTCQ